MQKKAAARPPYAKPFMPPRQFSRLFHFRDERALRRRRLVAALMALPGFVPALAHAQLSGDAAQPQRLGDAWNLKLDPQLVDHPLAPGQRAASFVIGDAATGTADTDMASKGSAEVRSNVSVVKADALHYDEDTDMADAYGNVHVVQNGTTFVGPEGHLQVSSNAGFMPVPKYHFTETGGSGSAQRADLIDNERSKITNGTYTACDCQNGQKDPAWYMRGSTLDFDTGADDGVARNAVLFFAGVPIFASPWISFPLSGDRRSGVLPPTFSISSNNGYEIAVPYYFNIAPNRDLTFTPELISRRGVFMQATARYLSTNYSGSFTGEFLPDDAITKSNRYAIYFQHKQDLGNGFAAYVNYNRVSDNQYPADLGSTSSQFLNGTQTLFQQEAGVTYNNGPWSVLARVQHWQTIQPSLPPYGREPDLNVKYTKYNVGGFDFGAMADYSHFTITTDNMSEGNRITFDPYVSYTLMGPSYFVTPKVQWHFAAYNMTSIGTDVPSNEPKNFTESIPTLSFDSGLQFERPVHLFGTDYIQTLEPRLYYVYTPYRNQDFAPLFDTAVADTGLAELFTPNTFVGDDRIADANRITAALTTRFLNAANGDERARFVIAQQYYFANQRVTLLPGESVPNVAGSNLIAGTSFKLGAGFTAQAAFQYNTDHNQLVQANAGFGFSPGANRVLNIAYVYTRADETLGNELVNQVLLSGEWPLWHHAYGVARLDYDLTNHRVVDGLVGLQYEGDCWAIGVGVQRYANGVTSTGGAASTTRFLMQFTLKGLSKIDNGLMQTFRAGIRGYTPPPPAPPEPSRFTNYE